MPMTDPGTRDLLPAEALRFLRAARVGHLATADETGAPSVVPVCFAIEPPRLFTPLDAKPKRGDPLSLRRVRNLRANPRVSLVADRWDEDWRRLGWVLLRGRAGLWMPDAGAPHAEAVDLLRDKYPQYREMPLETLPVIAIEIESCRTWGDLTPPAPTGTAP